MGSLRTPGTGETIASHEQEGEKVQEVGPMLWNPDSSPPKWERAVKAHGAYAAQPTTGMVAVVPQIMGSTGEVAPFQSAAAATDNNVGNNFIEVVPGLCNAAGNFDQQRNNAHGLVALVSEARTATAASPVITNYNWTKLHIALKITGNPGGGKALTVSVFDGGLVVCRFTAVTAPRVFQMAPGLEVGTPGNAEDALRENAVLPARFIIQVIPSDSSSWTYEVTYDLLV